MVLLLLSVNIFLAALAILSVLLRLHGGEGFIVQYRASLGISAFKTGSVSNILMFIGFALVALAANAAISYKTYPIRRQLSLAVLSLGVVLLGVSIIVINALLALH